MIKILSKGIRFFLPLILAILGYLIIRRFTANPLILLVYVAGLGYILYKYRRRVAPKKMKKKKVKRPKENLLKLLKR
ncbi:MAG: hypothetical protein ACE5K0_09595 [Candidatus Methanofastidiosia archaeon]